MYVERKTRNTEKVIWGYLMRSSNKPQLPNLKLLNLILLPSLIMEDLNFGVFGSLFSLFHCYCLYRNSTVRLSQGSLPHWKIKAFERGMKIKPLSGIKWLTRSHYLQLISVCRISVLVSDREKIYKLGFLSKKSRVCDLHV